MGRSNEAWLADLQSGGSIQQAALMDLRRALIRGLRRALASYSGADDAFLEDAAQESLLRILDRLTQFAGRSQFVTWATAIAIRVALSELRRQRWKDISLNDLTNESNALPVRSIADEGQSVGLERTALLEKMHEVIENELTEKQRLALHAELKGMPLDEIARHMGSNRNAVYKLTHDARKRLKSGLENAGYRLGEYRSAFAN